MMKQRAVAHPGPRRDLPRRRPLEAVRHEGRQCGVEDDLLGIAIAHLQSVTPELYSSQRQQTKCLGPCPRNRCESGQSGSHRSWNGRGATLIGRAAPDRLSRAMTANSCARSSQPPTSHRLLLVAAFLALVGHAGLSHGDLDAVLGAAFAASLLAPAVDLGDRDGSPLQRLLHEPVELLARLL